MVADEYDKNEILEELSFCVIDLETTGGNLERDKIIEIGLVHVHRLKIIEELTYLVNPQIPIPEFIQNLTDIRAAQLQTRPTIDQIIDEILSFIGHKIIVAHNSSFDVPFLNSVLVRLGKEKLNNKILCTNIMTKNLIPDIISSNLTYLSQIFHIEHSKAHRALEDAKACAKLLIKYLCFLKEKNITKVNQIYYPRFKFELDSCHIKGSEPFRIAKEKLKTLSIPTLVLIKGENGILLQVIPLKNPVEEIIPFSALIDQLQLDASPNINISLKIFGSFIGALLQTQKSLFKLSPQNQKILMDYLIFTHLKTDFNSQNLNEETSKVIFIKHLIGDQFQLFLHPSQSYKRDFIFRFPNHLQKVRISVDKFFKRKFKPQNINHNINVNKNIHPIQNPNHRWSDFFQSYLVSYPNEHMTWTHFEHENNPEFLDKKLSDFAKLNPMNWDYPNQHI